MKLYKSLRLDFLSITYLYFFYVWKSYGLEEFFFCNLIQNCTCERRSKQEPKDTEKQSQ